jgi:hypothetical protein
MVDRRLGRGLDFFLSGGRGAQPQAAGRADVADLQKQGDDEVLMVDVGSLDVSPYQPRKTIGEAELKELAESIRASGILQPILARRVGERFELVAGERRWRAAQLAGLTKVPVLVRAITDQDGNPWGPEQFWSCRAGLLAPPDWLAPPKHNPAPLLSAEQMEQVRHQFRTLLYGH